MTRPARRASFVAALASLTLAGSAAAQPTAGEWSHTLVLYGMGAAIDGSAGIGDVEVEVDVSASEVLDALEMGTMAAYRAENGTWSLTVDATVVERRHLAVLLR